VNDNDDEPKEAHAHIIPPMLPVIVCTFPSFSSISPLIAASRRQQSRSSCWTGYRKGDISPYDKRIATYFMAHFAEASGKRDAALRFFSDLARTAPDPREDIARLSEAAASRLQKR
jgi:hypothetical protein